MEKTYTIEVEVTVRASGKAIPPTRDDPGSGLDLNIVEYSIPGRPPVTDLAQAIDDYVFDLANNDDWYNEYEGPDRRDEV